MGSWQVEGGMGGGKLRAMFCIWVVLLGSMVAPLCLMERSLGDDGVGERNKSSGRRKAHLSLDGLDRAHQHLSKLLVARSDREVEGRGASERVSNAAGKMERKSGEQCDTTAISDLRSWRASELMTRGLKNNEGDCSSSWRRGTCVPDATAAERAKRSES